MLSPETADRFWSKVDKSGDCWLWQAGKFQSGYGAFQLDGKAQKAHRLAYAWEYGPIPNGLFACHHCDTPACVRPSHIFLGTAADNMRDRDMKGRVASGMANGMNSKPETRRRGSLNGNSHLSERDVATIRELRAGGMSGPKIARRFNVDSSAVYRIEHGATWAHA